MQFFFESHTTSNYAPATKVVLATLRDVTQHISIANRALSFMPYREN